MAPRLASALAVDRHPDRFADGDPNAHKPLASGAKRSRFRAP
jgi:hypothetical protein